MSSKQNSFGDFSFENSDQLPMENDQLLDDFEEMVNFEEPVHVCVPKAAAMEVDPLLPVESPEDPVLAENSRDPLSTETKKAKMKEEDADIKEEDGMHSLVSKDIARLSSHLFSVSDPPGTQTAKSECVVKSEPVENDSAPESASCEHIEVKADPEDESIMVGECNLHANDAQPETSIDEALIEVSDDLVEQNQVQIQPSGERESFIERHAVSDRPSQAFGTLQTNLKMPRGLDPMEQLRCKSFPSKDICSEQSWSTQPSPTLPQDSQIPKSPSQHAHRVSSHTSENKTNSNNRILLALLIKTICFVNCSGGHDHSQPEIEDYLEFITYVISSCDEFEAFKGKHHSFTSSFVYCNAPRVARTIERYLKSKIVEELRSATYVSLFFEDLSPIVDHSTVAVITHFVNQNGVAQQRILDLIRIDIDRSAGRMFSIVESIVFKWGLQMKVVGYTYTATLVHPAEISAFNERVEQLCPKALFFHHQGHNLLQLMFQAISHHNEKYCHVFMALLDFEKFFTKHLRPYFGKLKENFGLPELPSDVLNIIDKNLIVTLRFRFSAFIKCLENVVQQQDEWDVRVAAQAPIFLEFLNNDLTSFMIELITKLYLAVLDLSNFLESDEFNLAESKNIVQRVCGVLANVRMHGFEDILESTPCWRVKGDFKAPRETAGLREFFNDVVDSAINFLSQRFQNIDSFYIDLNAVKTSLKAQPQAWQNGNFSGVANYLRRVPHTNEETDKLMAQILFFDRDAFFKGKTPAECLAFFYSYEMRRAVPELVDFLNFTLSLPCRKYVSHFPVVETILKWRLDPSRSPKNYSECLWRDKEMLTSILSTPKFVEDIANIFSGSDGEKFLN